MSASASATAILLILSMATVGTGREAGPSMISGLVTGPDGRPAPGAEVIASGGDWGGEPRDVLGRAVADGHGRFSMDLGAGACDCDRPTLWAYRPGSVAASILVDRAALAGSPVRLDLGSPARAEFRVAGPDGRLLVGARVIPRKLSRDDLMVPADLADRAGATTDAEGRAVLGAFRPEELVSVRVEAAGFGSQDRDFREGHGQAGAGVKGITLIAPGRVSGRVVGDDPSAVSGLKVRVSTSAGARQDGEGGVAEVTTDAAGRFEVGAIAAGLVSVRVSPRPGSPDLPGRMARVTLEPGRSVSVEVPLRRGVRVAGFARDVRDGRPIPGVLVAVVQAGPSGLSRVWTDAQGRFETHALSGLVTHRILRVPDPYLCPPEFLGPRPVEVPPAIARFDLPPIALTRGVDLRGSVVDDQSRPVGGALVEASWTLFDGRVRAPRVAAARTEPDGSYLLGPVDPVAELFLSASSGPLTTPEPVRSRASGDRPIVLTVVGTDAASPSGRVLDARGRPVAGASVRIWGFSDAPGGSIVSFDGVDHLTTDIRGRFQGPKVLRPDRAYRVQVEAEGFLGGRTAPTRPGRLGVVTFPEIVLEFEPRRLSIEGRIVDRRGRPVTGADVRAGRDGPCLRQAVTGPDGRFRLDGLSEGREYLFASAEGFRFAGRAIDPAVGPSDFILARLDEAPDRSMTTRMPVAPSPALARGVVANYVERVLSQGGQATRVRALERLARIDPRRALALVDARGPEDAWFADDLRLAAVGGLIGTASTAEALAAIAGIREPRWRARAELEAADALPAASRGSKREWVERAWADSRSIRDPEGQAVALAGVASRLINLGEVDRASRILAEARPIAEALPLANAGGRARAAFAEALAQVDLDGALGLTKDLVDPNTFDRSRLKVARTLAGRDPAKAARVLATLRDPKSTNDALPGLCHDLARFDAAQARQLIGQARADDPCLPAYALGMMALAVADVDKLEATARLREAFDLLADRADSASTSPKAPRDPAAVAAALLPVAERVDPRLVPELFWRALSLHVLKPPGESGSDAIFAMLLARYDREVALACFEPLTGRISTATGDDLEPLMAAAAVLDPALAARLVEGMPEAPDLAFHHPKNGARLALAAALTRPAPACWDEAVARFLDLRGPGSPVDD